MSKIDYKQKYMELKMKYMEAVDQAFRLGFEQGQMQAQQDQMMQQQAEQAQLEQAMAGQPPGMENQNPDAGAPGAIDETAPGQNAQGTELDQHIAKLESMMGSNEAKPEEMAKALSAIKAFRAEQLQQIELKKSSEAISGIAKALHKPAFKIGKQASVNMTDNAKRAVGMQHRIVDDIMKAWTDEEQNAGKEIKKVLDVEGLAKKE